MRLRHFMSMALTAAALTTAAFAGPPFVSDDPQPTPYRHWEIYSFTNGTNTRDGTTGEAGFDFNYGAGPDLQLTATLPAGFESAPGGPLRTGFGNIELAAKYRFIHQADWGWDVAVFPRVFLPSASAVGDRDPSFLLPVWVQRDLGQGWSTFGGGGCLFAGAGSSQNSCMAGWVVTRDLAKNLHVGAELFHQTGDAAAPAATSLGVGITYDLNDTYHLLGYVRRGLQNTEETDRLSWYAAVLSTF
jgi:hypothetical protein